jgi:hypothetical protein
MKEDTKKSLIHFGLKVGMLALSIGVDVGVKKIKVAIDKKRAQKELDKSEGVVYTIEA